MTKTLRVSARLLSYILQNPKMLEALERAGCTFEIPNVPELEYEVVEQ